jgi:hypothetical protein
VILSNVVAISANVPLIPPNVCRLAMGSAPIAVHHILHERSPVPCEVALIVMDVVNILTDVTPVVNDHAVISSDILP